MLTSSTSSPSYSPSGVPFILVVPSKQFHQGLCSLSFLLLVNVSLFFLVTNVICVIHRRLDVFRALRKYLWLGSVAVNDVDDALLWT